MPQSRVPRFLTGPLKNRSIQAAIQHALAEWTDQIDSSDRLDLPTMLVVRPRRTYMPALFLIRSLRHPNAANQIDQALAFLRAGPRNQAICWAAAPLQPPSLGAYLFARGFEENWQSNWMLLDLHTADLSATTPGDLIVHQAVALPRDDLSSLPYYDPTEASQIIAAAKDHPHTLWQLFGQLEGRIVGQCVLQLTYGTHGIATLRNIGVDPAVRRRGIGRALTNTALQLAQRSNCRYVLLSATDEGAFLYQQLGFQSLGRVPTWLLRPDVLAQTPLPDQQVALAQAAGLGHLATLESLMRANPEWINQPLPTTLTPLRIATIMHKCRAVQRLATHGATLDICSAWELGLRATAARLLHNQPALANYRLGRWGLTPLHIAAQTDDHELARLVLTANPDLSIRDGGFGSTALGWAIHFQRDALITMIRAHQTDHGL